MAKARIEILGDSSSYQRAVKEAAVVTDRLSIDMKRLESTATTSSRVLAVSAQSSAQAQVAASIRKTARLQKEVAAYDQIARAAKLGSREQIVAADLAAKARTRLATVAPPAQLTASGAARVKVTESVRTTEALRSEAAAYRQLASRARKGSSEQVAAAQLAARAERNLAGALGVSSRESARLSRSASHVERDLGRATRGALAGSGVFRSLGRSIAFASGGFLAFATAGQFIRKSIDAAIEGQVSIKQLSTQLRNSGKSYADYRGQIEKTDQSLSALSGFQDDELRQSLTTILRTTGNVSKALRDNATAADLARARHIGLAQASLIIAKTEAGNTTLLRRQGFQIAKNATAEQALAKLRSVVTGQARAGTTAQQRFGAVLHNSEEIIGRGLLPSLTQYLEAGTRWLTQMNESGRLQKDVNEVMHTTEQILRGVKDIITPIIGAFRLLGKAAGGTENEVKLLGTAFVLFKTRAALVNWGLINGGIAGIGSSAAIAAGEVTTLRTRLLGLSKLGPIAGAVALSFIPKANPSTNPNAPSRNPVAKTFADLPIVGGLFSQANKLADTIDKRLGLLPKAPLPKPPPGLNPATRGFVQSTPTNPSGELRFGDKTTGARATLNQTFAQAKLLNPNLTRKAFDLGQKVAQAFIDGIGKPPPGKGKAQVAKGLSLQGRFNLAELRLAQAQLTKTTADDRKQLLVEASITREQIAHVKTLKDKTALTQRLVGIMGQLKSAAAAASDAFTLPAKFDLATAKAAVTLSTVDDLAAARARQAAINAAVQSGRLKGQKLVSALDQLAQVNDQVRSAQQEATQSVLDRLQAKVDFAAQTEGARDDIKAMTALRAELERQVKVQKSNLDLQKQLREVSGQLASAKQFQALGLSATGEQLTPGTKALKRELGHVSTIITGTFLDTSKELSVLSRIRRVLSGGLGAVTKDVRAQIKQMLDDIDQQLKDHASGPQTKFQTVNTAKVLAGLGLSAAQVKAARARLSQLGAGGTVPGKGTSAFGYVVPAGDTVIHTHVKLDGREVAASTTRHQQKRHRRNPPQKRGPHAGGGI